MVCAAITSAALISAFDMPRAISVKTSRSRGTTPGLVSRASLTAAAPLVMTGEYSSGLIRVTFSVLPRWPLVLLAKACVFGVTALAAGELTTFASFLLGTAVLRPGVPHPSPGDPAVLRAVVLTGAYLALIGLTGLGVGALVRHGAAAVATVVGALFVLPVIAGAARTDAGKFLPELIAGNSLAAVKPVAGFGWSPWLELGIVALYPAVLLTAGCWLLNRRDA